MCCLSARLLLQAVPSIFQSLFAFQRPADDIYYVSDRTIWTSEAVSLDLDAVGAAPYAPAASLWSTITGQSSAWWKLRDSLNYLGQSMIWVGDQYFVDHNYNFATNHISTRRKFQIWSSLYILFLTMTAGTKLPLASFVQTHIENNGHVRFLHLASRCKVRKFPHSIQVKFFVWSRCKMQLYVCVRFSGLYLPVFYQLHWCLEVTNFLKIFGPVSLCILPPRRILMCFPWLQSTEVIRPTCLASGPSLGSGVLAEAATMFGPSSTQR